MEFWSFGVLPRNSIYNWSRSEDLGLEFEDWVRYKTVVIAVKLHLILSLHISLSASSPSTGHEFSVDYRAKQTNL